MIDFGTRSANEFWLKSINTRAKYARGVVVGGVKCPSIKAAVKHLWTAHGIYVSDYKMRKEAKQNGEIGGVTIQFAVKN